LTLLAINSIELDQSAYATPRQHILGDFIYSSNFGSRAKT